MPQAICAGKAWQRIGAARRRLSLLAHIIPARMLQPRSTQQPWAGPFSGTNLPVGPPAALLHLVLLIVLVAGLVTYVPSATAAPAMSVDDELASFVDEYRKTQGLPGISYTVLDDGEVTASGGSGTLQADTPVPIASVSKPFTAFAVLQLVDDGDIRLMIRSRAYCQNSPWAAPTRTITIRMLLSHPGLPQPTILPETGSYTQVWPTSDLR